MRAQLATPAKLLVSVDGAVVGNFDLPTLGVVPPVAINQVELKIGIVSEGTPQQPRKLRFDEVSLDVLP
jgi:hypothetical protein